MRQRFISKIFIKSNIGYYFIIILLAVLFCLPAFMPEKTFYAFDNLSRYYPWKSLDNNLSVNNKLITDPANAFYPPLFFSSHRYFNESLRNGEIPLWYKNILGGLPFYSYYTGPVFITFYGLFSFPTAHDLLLFLHLAMAGIFMFLFMQQIGLCKFASLISSIAWMFSGYIMVWFEFEHIPMLAAVLPATLFFIEKYFLNRSLVSWLMIVFCFGYTFCVNYAHVIIYQFLFIGVYILYRFILAIRQKAFSDCLKNFLGLVTASCCSLILGLNFFITHFEMLSYGQRKILEFKELFIRTGQLPFKYLGTLLFPNLFGNPATQLTFTPAMYLTQVYNNYNELCIYAGAVVLFLVLISFVRFRKNSRWSFFFLVAIYSLLSAMGSWLYYPLAKFVPGLSQTTPTRIIYICSFCMAGMAGIGMQAIIIPGNKKKIISIISGILLIIAVSLALAVNTDAGLKYILSSNLISYKSGLYNRAITYLSLSSCHIWEPLIYIFECFVFIQVAVWCRKKARRTALILIVLLMSLELMLHGWNYNTVSDTDMAFPETPGLAMIKNNSDPARCVTIGKFMPNGLAVSGLETIGGYASLYPKDYGNYFVFSKTGKVNNNVSLSRWLNTNNYYSPFYELMNTKYLIFSPDIVFKKSAGFDRLFKQIYNKEIVIYENKFAFPRAFGTTGFKVVDNSNSALNEIKNMGYKKLRNNVILHDIPDFTDISARYKVANGIMNTRIVDYNTNSMLVYSASLVPGFIVISNNWHPGWKAYVDGKPAKILKANGFMQAVKVPLGKHKIELLFRPWLGIIGIIVSLCGWGILFILLIVIFIKHLICKYFYRTNQLGA